MKTSFQLYPEHLTFESPFRSADSGAEVIFEGIVRSPNKGKQVLYLEFEAYEALFRNEMNRIAIELHEKFDLHALVLHHRIGKVYPGECAVVAAVYAKHRDHAFVACAELMNELKKSAPIWKKEYHEDGSFWVSTTP
ncbi:MAG: molybdenum cofactor biosynthesis protein MoaE [Bacteroidota bacterium]